MAKKTETAWKVVDKETGDLCSCIVTGRNMVRYKIGKWAKPRINAPQCLFVFQTRKDARFMKDDESYLFKCQIEPMEKVKAQHELLTKIKETRNVWPAGTIFAKKVKLLGKPR